jgi:hypothetical protein
MSRAPWNPVMESATFYTLLSVGIVRATLSKIGVRNNVMNNKPVISESSESGSSRCDSMICKIPEHFLHIVEVQLALQEADPAHVVGFAFCSRFCF